MKIACVLLSLILTSAVSGAAFAGAWTEGEGHWQIISGGWVSAASRAFDDHANPGSTVSFKKYLLQVATDYGWSDDLTLFFNAESVYADMTRTATLPQRGFDSAFEGGARRRLWNDFGVLSAQASYKSAGAYNFSVSADGKDGGQAMELRLLYGMGFTFDGYNAFVDAELGERFVSGVRPNETPIDLTAGIWITPNCMMMAHSFNLVSGGNAAPPYTYYRSHKLVFSLVRRLGKNYLVQLGAFFSPLGQNALVEQGLNVGFWTQI
jgi:hypothetical protein